VLGAVLARNNSSMTRAIATDEALTYRQVTTLHALHVV
jgi:hypothetical protein